jgi:putative DNA primase/helicase
VIEAPPSPVLAAALRWCKRGAAPIPVRFREKVPIGEAWQKQRITAVDAAAVFDGAPLNIGILWGEPSGHVVDVDLDWPEACGVAAALLPATASYGRASSRQSHRLYRVPGAVTAKWSVPAELVPDGHKSGMVLELRADGTQSVVPPSTHPSGEVYAWEREQRPHALDYAALLRLLNLVAAGAVLVRHWREGVRHHIALALAGAALSSGYAADEAKALITAIAETAGDPESSRT